MPEQILAAAGAHQWAITLSELRSEAQKTTATVRMVMSRALSFIADPALAASVLPAPGTGFHIPAFLRGGGTLYMIAEAVSGEAPVAPLFAAMASDCFYCVPKWSLWRWVAGALGQVLACLAHRHARPAGGGADIADRREQGVLPEIIGLPPGDLLKQVRFGPAMERCRGQHGVLELLLARPRKVHSGRNRSRSASKGSGSARLAWDQSSASAMQLGARLSRSVTPHAARAL